MKGRKALISGGASGIGKAIATKLIQEDVAAAVAGINLTGEMPPALQAYTCNVAAGTGVNLLFTSLQTSPGAPGILICNAGRGIHKKMLKGDLANRQQPRQATLEGSLRLICLFVLAILMAGQAYTYAQSTRIYI